MKQILSELNKCSTILIETSYLPEFWEYISKEKDFYSFRYEYIDTMVKITITGKTTIIKIKA
jgi:hypothetical protein